MGENEVAMNLLERIQEEILNGTLEPGSKVNISELKEAYNVSLAPLREALSRLVHTGLVISEKNKGYTIAPISKQEFEDLYETSAHIEVLALEQAIERGKEDWEEEIILALHHLKKIETAKKRPDFKVWSEANKRFHDALIAACSPLVKELRDLVHLKAERYVRIAFEKLTPEFHHFHKEHAALAKACLDRDTEKACDLIIKHNKKAQNIDLKGI